MGFMLRLRAAGAAMIGKSATGAAIPSQGFLPTLGATPSAAGLNISQGTAMAVSAVYACVTVRSQDFARCAPRLFRRQPDGSRIQDKDYLFNQILRRSTDLV